jgi:chromate transporter
MVRTAGAANRLDSIVPTPPRTLWELFLGFLSIGARSFGGVLPAAHTIMVEKRRWLTPADFTETCALCQILPGPNIGNASIVLGRRWFGISGAVVAFLGLFALPYLWVLTLAMLYMHWGAHPSVSAVVTGAGAAGAGLFIATAVKLGRPIAGKPGALALIAGCFVLVAIARMSLVIVMPIALTVGILFSARGRL